MFNERPTTLTLIELLIVVSILAIVVVIGLPAYQDYKIRSQVNKMLTMSDMLKNAVAQDRTSNGNFNHIDPNNPQQTLQQLGITDPAVLSTAISEINFAKANDNFVAIVLCGDTAGQGTHAEDTVDIYLTGTYYSSGMKWGCQYTGNSKYVPANCRTEYEPEIYGTLPRSCMDAAQQVESVEHAKE